MKRFLSAVALVLFVLTFFTACGKNQKQNKPANASASSQVLNDNEIHKLSSTWCGQAGIYSITPYVSQQYLKGSSEIVNGKGQKSYINHNVIQFFDYKNMNSIVLCNKPNCKHNGESCNAYISGSSSQDVICGYKDKIYVVDIGNANLFGKSTDVQPTTITEINLDGTNHSKVVEIPDKYYIKDVFLNKGNLYINSVFSDEAGNNGEKTLNNDNIKNTAMLSVDLSKKAFKEIYHFKGDVNDQVLGITDDKAYYLYKSEEKPLTVYNQKALDEQMNNLDTVVYSVNFSDGKKTEILKDKSYGISPVVMDKQYLYYHSRRDGKLIKYDIGKNEKKVLVNNLNGYIKFFDNSSVKNNKLFYIKDNKTTYTYAKPEKDNETFYVDVNNGNVTSLSYEVKKSNGKSENMTDFPLETPDYYIIKTNIDVEYSTLEGGETATENVKKSYYGIIGKDDFWKSDWSKIKKIEWNGFREMQNQ